MQVNQGSFFQNLGRDLKLFFPDNFFLSEGIKIPQALKIFNGSCNAVKTVRNIILYGHHCSETQVLYQWQVSTSLLWLVIEKKPDLANFAFLLKKRGRMERRERRVISACYCLVISY